MIGFSIVTVSLATEDERKSPRWASSASLDTEEHDWLGFSMNQR
jgi:hypothetical protein